MAAAFRLRVSNRMHCFGGLMHLPKALSPTLEEHSRSDLESDHRAAAILPA